ncbi:hypothetical protein D3C74_50930 [compost metagenome]
MDLSKAKESVNQQIVEVQAQLYQLNDKLKQLTDSYSAMVQLEQFYGQEQEQQNTTEDEASS